MRILKKEIAADANIFLFGDDHGDSVQRSDKGFNRLCNIMESEYMGVKPNQNWGVHHGDHIEAIKVDDKRISPAIIDGRTEYSPYPSTQNRNAIKRYKPIANHLVTVLEGNHPWKLWTYGPLTQEFCQDIKVEYGTWTVKIAWFLKGTNRLLFRSFHTHGRKSITSTADSPKRRKSNRELILQRQLKFKMGDCILMCKGHTHQLIIFEPEPELYITDDGRKTLSNYTKISQQNSKWIEPDLRWYVNTGSFLKMYIIDKISYVEMGEYDPIELGFAIARVRDGRLIAVDPIRFSTPEEEIG
jgi:hypothetical protein